jgi:hypothetical protein
MQALHRLLDEWGDLKFTGCPDLKQVFWIVGTANIRDIIPHIVPITTPSEGHVYVEELFITHSVDCVGLFPVREDEVPAVERAIKDDYETQIDRINVGLRLNRVHENLWVGGKIPVFSFRQMLRRDAWFNPVSIWRHKYADRQRGYGCDETVMASGQAPYVLDDDKPMIVAQDLESSNHY